MGNKQKKDSKELTKVNKNESVGFRFVDTIKKRWLINGTSTILLIAILVTAVILINLIVESLELTPIDCTSNKEYTLTAESKERVENIQDIVEIYCVGFSSEDGTMALLNQFNKANKNINVETVDITERIDLADEYGITNEDMVIIVKSGEKSKIISSYELVSDEGQDITEEKITSSILNITSKDIPNIYFLKGYTEYGLDYGQGLYYLSAALKNEILNYKELDILSIGNIPEDCDTLVITTPSRDFDELTTNKIIDFINNGGNILWLNSSYGQSVELKNTNKILALYGINPFEVGYIYETNNNNIILGYNGCIVTEIESTEITDKLKEADLMYSTKINVNEEALEQLNVKKQELIRTSDTTYFRKNIANTSNSTNGDEQGGFLIGGIFTKKVSGEAENEINSNLAIFGDNDFVSDLQINSQIYPMIYQANNKDLVLNSIAYLTDKKEDITIRKNYTQTASFTATDGQKSIIIKVIFIVPLLIIVIGFVVWQIRRRRK